MKHLYFGSPRTGTGSGVATRVTQTAAEVFGTSSAALAARTTQVVVEVVGGAVAPGARVTQAVLEVFGKPPEFVWTRDPAIGLTWVEFTDAAGTTHVWSDVALPDPQSYFYGYKDNRVTRWGTIRRSLSDDQGEYVGSEFRWTVSDADRAVRALLANPATRAFANRWITVRSLPDAARRRLERPRDIYVGIVRSYQPSSPLSFDFVARDAFDALFSVTGDQRFPRRTITKDDFPQCDGSFAVGGNPDSTPPLDPVVVPIGALGLPVPIIYGTIQDADGELGDGQCPAILVGVKTLSDGKPYFQFVVAGHACQQIAALYVNNNLEDPAQFGVGGIWKVPGYPGWAAEFPHAHYEDINGRRYTTIYGQRAPEAAIVSSNEGTPTGSPGVVYAPAHGLTTGSRTLIQGHQGSTPALDGVWDTITVVDADHFTVPVVLTEAGTGGYALQARGPDVAAGATSTVNQFAVPFSLTVSGIETIGDGTGDLITEAFSQYRHCLQNWIIGDYQAGAWLPTPEMPTAALSYRDLVIADGAVAYWRLGETSGTTARSEVGAYNGTISGGVTLGQAGALADGNPAMAFNGTTGKIAVGALVIPAASTVEAWIRFTMAGQATIVGCDAGGTADTYGVFSGGKVYQYNGNVGVQSTALSYNDGQWHHVVFVHTGTALSIFVDGVVTNVNGVGYARPSQSGVFGIAWVTNDPHFWNGGLDEIAIYPVALTPTQIAAHYAARTGNPPHLALIDDGSFDRARAIAFARIGGGYRGDFVLGWTAVGPNRSRIGGDRVTARDLLQRFNQSFDCQVGFNRRSQFFVSLSDDAATPSTALTDMVDTVKDSLVITDQVERLWNRVPVRHTQDYFNRMSGPDAKPLVDGQDNINWRNLMSGIAYVEDAASIAAYSLDPTHPTPMIAPTQFLYMVRGKNRDIDTDAMLQGTATANDVVARFLNRHKDPPRQVELQIGQLGWNFELGDLFTLTHFAGVGATGWTNHILRVIAQDSDPGTHLVTITAEEVRDLAPEAHDGGD